MNVHRLPLAPKLSLRGMISALTAIVVLASGCTTVPVKDFSSYREAVNKTRAAAETVVTEHSVVAFKSPAEINTSYERSKDFIGCWHRYRCA